jgi:hypothetical protein
MIVSGRAVTNRGVHGPPTGHHTGWMPRADYWVGLLQSMRVSWMTLLSDSDAVVAEGAAEALLEGGVIPVVRCAYQFPDEFDEMAAVEKLVAVCARHGAPCVVQFANEPFDSREWRGGRVPPEDAAWPVIAGRWHQAERVITERGAVAGFPDGPCYSRNPFAEIGDPGGHFEAGRAVYLGHFYGKGRPVDYPRDAATRLGQPTTLPEWEAALDDYAADPAWDGGQAAVDRANAQRAAWADPDCEDDACWRGWEKVLRWGREALGFDVRVAMTEGGWVPRDRAGSAPADVRWPLTTPKMVAKKTLAMFEAESPLWFQTPWLLACSLMGATGWEFDSWVTGAYRPNYWLELPVVRALQAADPAREKVREAKARVEAAQAALRLA